MAGRLFLNETKRLAQIFGSVHLYNRQTGRSNGKEPTQAKDELWEQALLISALAVKERGTETDMLIREFVAAVHATSPVPLVEELRSHIALEFFDKVTDPAYREFLKSYVRADQAKKTEIYRKKVEANYREEQDPDVIKVIRRFARAAGLADAATGDPQKLRWAMHKLPVHTRLEKSIKNVSKRTPDIMSYGPFSGYLEEFLKLDGMTAAKFEERFSFLLREFPELAADLEKAATSQQEHSYSDLPIAWPASPVKRSWSPKPTAETKARSTTLIC
jgi:hypothetical protein